jgi:hypothetical protein
MANFTLMKMPNEEYGDNRGRTPLELLLPEWQQQDLSLHTVLRQHPDAVVCQWIGGNPV